MEMKTQLLCTFTDKVGYKEVIETIKNNFQIAFNYIYVLQNKELPNELYITYNIVSEDITNKINLKTILVHRKKHSNTLYTINALNQLVVELNGALDPHFQIDWEKYKNCILVTNTEGVKKISTRIFDIIEIK
jgi:hypothetical protein